MSDHDPFAPAVGNTVPKTGDVDAVPAGTRAEILSWVGSSKSRARKALVAETSHSQPRKTLIAELKGVVSS